MKRRFTKTYLESLVPSGKVATYTDDQIPGLGIAVYPSGTKRFFFRRRTAAFDTGRIPIGTWRDGRVPDMTIREATDRCRKLNEQVNAGINPGNLQSARQKVTFGQLYQRYLSDHVHVHNKSDRRPVGQWQLYLKKWSRRPLESIEPADIAALFSGIVAAGHAPTANQVLAQLHKMFELAVDWGYLEHNPSRRVKKAKTRSRRRKLEDHEFPAFMQALSRYHSRDPRDAILLMMFTGQRSCDILRMRWDDLHLGTGPYWITDTKNVDDSRLPLSTDAVEVIVKRREVYDLLDRRVNVRPSQQERTERRRERTLPFVFRGRGSTGHITNIHRPWKEICTAAGIPDLWIHDLRRTFISLNANHGTQMAVTSRLASHRNIATTAKVYTIVDANPMREAVNMTAGIIKKLSTGS